MKTVVALTLLLAGCSADSGDAGSGGGAPCPEPEQGLFACDDTLTCPELYSHLGWTDSSEATACAGELIDANGRGLVRAVYSPGPYVHEDWWLVALRGDGTAWVQTRHIYDERPADDDESCWVIDPILVCDVAAPFCSCPEEGPCGCTWNPGYGLPEESSSFTGCVPADVAPTCTELAALLVPEGDGGDGGGGGGGGGGGNAGGRGGAGGGGADGGGGAGGVDE